MSKFFATADKQIKLYHSRREVLTPTLKDNSVNLILEDYPYFKVKTAEWDNQWKTATDYLAWLDTTLAESVRILAANGSLYVFASPQMSARVECLMGERFNVLNNIRWYKSMGWHHKAKKEKLRGYLTPWESIIFAEHKNADSTAKGEAAYQAECDKLRGFVFEPLRAYLDGERMRAGVTYQECNAGIGKPVKGGGMATHYFSDPRTLKHPQWTLPTAEHYKALQELFNRNQPGEYLRRDYESLRQEYESLRQQYESLRRPFNANPSTPYTDVWDFRTVTPGGNRHICEKPEALIRHIIEMSSRPGDLVFDGFGGSFTTMKCAWDLGRRGIGCDMLLENCERGAARFNQRALI